MEPATNDLSIIEGAYHKRSDPISPFITFYRITSMTDTVVKDFLLLIFF
jgi:hypothetical protein